MGCRKGEALALTWNDIDFISNRIRINKTAYFAKGKRIITIPKTLNSYRSIGMPKALFNAMWSYHCEKDYADDVIFNLRPETVQQHLRKTIAKANECGCDLRLIQVHDFRHSAASVLTNNITTGDFTIYDVAQRLDDTVDTVQNTYAY